MSTFCRLVPVLICCVSVLASAGCYQREVRRRTYPGWPTTEGVERAPTHHPVDPATQGNRRTPDPIGDVFNGIGDLFEGLFSIFEPKQTQGRPARMPIAESAGNR